MAKEKPKPGAAGTTDQWPRWEGPPENRPRGHLPAKDNPDTDPDAAGETNSDPDRKTSGDWLKQGDKSGGKHGRKP